MNSFGANASGGKKKGACKICHQYGHWAADCPSKDKGSEKKDSQGPTKRGKRGGKGKGQENKQKDNANSVVICSKCNYRGHSEDQCYVAHPSLAPAGWAENRLKRLEEKKRKANQANGVDAASKDKEIGAKCYGLQALLNASQQLIIPHTTANHVQAAAEDGIVVFLDSGTDASVAPADVPLSNLQKMVGSTVRTAGSEVIKDPSLGTINLGKGSDGNDIHLRVLQHPKFRVFLLSVSQLQCIPAAGVTPPMA